MILWRVVDGLRAFSPYFDPAVFQGVSVGVDWITPDRALSHAEAIMHGLALSRGDYVLIMSPDMSPNVADIPAFLDEIDGGAVAVAGWRVQRNGISFIRRALTRLFNNLVRVLFRLKINDVNTCMALLTPKVVSFLLDAPPDCPSPALYTALSLRDEISEIQINVTENPVKNSTYNLRMRFMVGVGRLREVCSLLVWMRRGRGA